MKNFILIAIGVVVGLFLGANIGFRFTQDISAQVVEDVLDDTYSGLQLVYSGSSAEGIWLDFNEKLKENIEVKKVDLVDELKMRLWEKLFGKEDDRD